MRHKMAFEQRIEAAMAAAIARGQGSEAPSKLATALDYAVTPGGAHPAHASAQRGHGLRRRPPGSVGRGGGGA